MEEQIDILLATYNGEKFIEEQIESILKQTYKNIRLIISDDCSTDGTVNKIKKIMKNDNRIILVEQPKNLGVVKNIEFLLKKVENNFYMLSDQDDVWLPEKVEKSLKCLKQNDADLVFGDLEVVDQKLNTIYKSFGDFMLLNEKIKKYINSKELNYLYNCVTGCTIISKKEFINKILPLPTYSKYVLHDHWIGLMISMNGKLAYMEESYIKYRQHENNEVGTKKISRNMKTFEEVREFFINIKLAVFGTYVAKNEKFPEEFKKLNLSAYEYFKEIQNKKYFNFKNWKIFFKLYKNERKMYFLENFLIMNMPLCGKILFKIRYLILKSLGKR